ncbi:MAG TPA: ABC transporter ATP-binding protein [Armatimonadota bacterium]|nr:ABC transporter ATP-binding protein [Armatimonadota bacterium]
MITLDHASRWYGQVIGINDVTCQITTGITALLGPNGAGKSTLMRLVTGQLRPTTGRVTVFDRKPFANPAVFRKLGYCPEIEASYDDMTGREFVTMLAALGGVGSNRLKDQVAETLQQVGMAENAERKIGGYSKGMRQRIKLAQCIVHDPDVLILDEPLNGLDPVGRRDMAAILTRLAASGKCILVSSHILYEVEALTHNILLIHRGRLLAQGNVHQIRSLIDAHPHRISITAEDPRRLAHHLLDLPYVLSVRFDAARAGWLEIETRSPEAFYGHFPDLVAAANCPISSFESPDNNLEAVFRYLVGE